MKHIIFCVSGFSGVGKDEFSSRLVKSHGVIQTGLVDPAKRHMADLYGFSELQLFGPSKHRNSGDLRYPKSTNPMGFRRSDEITPEANAWSEQPVPWWRFEQGENDLDVVWVRQHDPKYWLSPREALQRYCELMNLMYGDTWVHKGVQTQREIALTSKGYDRMLGITNSQVSWPYGVSITLFSDFRHKHEFAYLDRVKCENVRPIYVRIKHPKIVKPPYDHRSETEQTQIPDSVFDHVIMNDGTISDLHDKADGVILTALHQLGVTQ